MKTWAIVVGVNQYPALAGQQVLHGAVADACDFADWALDPAGGAVASENLRFWTFPAPAAPTARLSDYLGSTAQAWDNLQTDWAAPDVTRAPYAGEIVSTIERIGRQAKEDALENGDDETRRVYVFLAGHGLRARVFGQLAEETCFLAQDFRPNTSNLVPGLIACESLRRSLLNNRFDEAILFLDCCRLQTSRLSLTAQPVCDFNSEPMQPFGLAFAAQDGLPAYETTTAPVRGAFSKTLLEGLRNCREGPASELHTERLRRYVIDNIGANTAMVQVPNFTFKPDPSGPLLVAGPPLVAGGGVPLSVGPLVNLAALPVGTQVVLKGGDNLPVPGVAPLVAGPVLVPLPELADGLYSLEVVGDPARYAMFRQPRQEPIDVG